MAQRPTRSWRCSYRFERRLSKQGFVRIAGVDEVGRGALCGPVVAAAVIFQNRPRIKGINDSKKLTSLRREWLKPRIEKTCLSFGIGIVGAEEIDRMNIFQATLKAMRIALEQLHPAPDFILVDGTKINGLPVASLNVVKGDSRCLTIAAASILAKVTRDHLMQSYASMYPMYGWVRNKGYSSRGHLEALKQYGRTFIHRTSFGPVQEKKQLTLLEWEGGKEQMPVS